MSFARQPTKVERIGNITLITFTDGKGRDVENVLAAELAGHTHDLGAGHLLLDFANVERVNSVELGTLISLHKGVKASGGRLTLFNLTAQIHEIFSTTRLDTLLEIVRERPMVLPPVPSA